MSNLPEVTRSVVKLGLDLSPIPLDVGDGIVWMFTSDPSAEQWSTLMTALKVFTKLKDDVNEDENQFTQALSDFSKAMSHMLLDPDQQLALGRKGLRSGSAAGGLRDPDGDVVGFPYEVAVGLWSGVEESWISLVTTWNMQGIRWREFSAVEILWYVHTNAVERMKEDKSPKIRMYLTSTKDYTSLREWDKAQMKD